MLYEVITVVDPAVNTDLIMDGIGHMFFDCPFAVGKRAIQFREDVKIVPADDFFVGEGSQFPVGSVASYNAEIAVVRNNFV